MQDSGIGINEEDQKKLFKVFGQIHHNDDINPKGIGLGLTICNNILGQLGSHLLVDSQPAKGSTFYFTLLLDVVTESQDMMPQVEQQEML